MMIVKAGMKIGNRTVLRRMPLKPGETASCANVYWECECQCGAKIVSHIHTLRYKTNETCPKCSGSKRVDHQKEANKRNLKTRRILYPRFKSLRSQSFKEILPFSIDYALFAMLSQVSCGRCGYYDPQHFNTIVRKDKEFGYIPNNLTSICDYCIKTK